MTDFSARTPEELGERFNHLFGIGDIDALVDLYEDEALFMSAEIQEARGRDTIRAAFEGLRSGAVTIHLDLRRIRQANGIAVFSHLATVGNMQPDGSTFTAPTIEIARRQSDGTWRYVIDDPSFLAFL